MIKAIICAAGSGSRWANYTGRRKHVALVDGEAVLQRTVNQLIARGVTDITYTYRADHPYEIYGAEAWLRPSDVSHMTSRKLTWSRWSSEGPTLLLLGDVWFSDAAMDAVVGHATNEATEWVQFGRLKPSAATGKPGAEMFGWNIPVGKHLDTIRAIETVQDASDAGFKVYNDWGIYTTFVGKAATIHPDDIRDWGHHVEIPDDGTDDFDFPDDYERWLATMHHRSSRLVNREDFDRDWFGLRTTELARARKIHRKLWEHCSLAQVFQDRYGDGGNYRALGFGIGKEPLPAWLAARGTSVVATDRPEQGIWLDRQHASSKDVMPHAGICTDEQFATVVYQPVDMNAIPEGLHGQFDFVWSSSCMEHLGGIEKGIDFFCEQMKCLKPGGVAAHTTELNLLSDTVTLNGKDLCVFRKQDIGHLAARLEAQGDRLWPVDFTLGETVDDIFVDSAPFREEPHLKLSLGGSVFTSVLLIAMRGYRRG